MKDIDVLLVMKHAIPVNLTRGQTNTIECHSLTANLALSAKENDVTGILFC